MANLPGLFMMGIVTAITATASLKFLWLMWKGLWNDLKRWKKMTKKEQDSILPWITFRVVVTGPWVFWTGAGVFAFFKVCQEAL